MVPTHWGRQLRLAPLGACALTLFCAAAAADMPIGGRLWHTNSAQNRVDGTHIASAQQSPCTISSLRGARPWPDGSQFVTAQPLTSDKRTVLEVHDTTSGKRLQLLRFKALPARAAALAGGQIAAAGHLE